MSCTIHVGHGKTGTSAIQSNLVRKRDALRAHGLIYPEHVSDKLARKGAVTSGNGALLFDADHQISNNSLYSSEALFSLLSQVDKIEGLLKRIPGDASDVTFIIYVRDIFSHSSSGWGQYVKRAGGVLDYNEFVGERYGAHLKVMQRWFKNAESLGFRIKVFNYSRHKRNIWQHFIENAVFGGKAGLDDITDIESNDRVNRSLTLSEYEFQRLFNKHYPLPSYSFISAKVIERLPELKSELPTISQEAYDKALSRIKPRIRAINKRITPEEKIRIESFEELNGGGASEDQYVFTQEQLEILVQSIAEKLLAPRPTVLAEIEKKKAEFAASTLKKDADK